MSEIFIKPQLQVDDLKPHSQVALDRVFKGDVLRLTI